MKQENSIMLFQEKQIRHTWHKEEWWFVVEDVIGVLTDSKNPKKYLAALRSRDKELAKGYPQIVDTLAVDTEGGKQRMTCSNRQGIFRIIMSVPSPKAEPFKMWLAQVGEERIQEIENPEMAVERAREIYKAKGYSDEWIETRLKTINIRKELTDEWKGRGVQEGQEYSILTAEIAKATFGLTPSDHKKFKNLNKENLRDHMTNLELIFTMLGEEATRQVAIKEDAQGFPENHDASQRGGAMAGDARQGFEKRESMKVVSPENFLNQIADAEKNNALSPDDTSKNVIARDETSEG